MARKKSQRKRELEAAAAKSLTGGAAAAAAKPRATSTPRGDGVDVAPAKTTVGLSINRAYAEKYEAVKRKQEAGRLRDLGINLATLDGDDDSEEASGDEEEEEEDEHAELLTRRVDKEISETLAKIRARDPVIYDPTSRFYKADMRGAKGGSGTPAGASGGATGDAAAAAATADDGGSGDDDSSSDSEDEPVAGWEAIARTAREAVAPKPVRIKDYVRERLLEDGKLESEESDEEVPRTRKGGATAAPHVALYNAEQAELKRSLVAAWESSGDDDAAKGGASKGAEDGGDEDASSGDDSDEFFTVRKRSSADDAAEEADFAAFQVKEGAALAREDGEQRLLHAYLENETPDEKEYFLREFVLNNGWLGAERHKAPRHGDSAFEVDRTVVDRGPTEPKVKDVDDDADADADPLDDDAAFVDNQELFEYGHNFRYEDAAAAEIVAHARTVAGSLRRKSDSRRKAREARRAAKAAARTAAVEEVKRQKNVLASEINERLREIEAAAGTTVADAAAWDLDGDWDPDAYAKAMDAQFGDDYYAAAKETEADVRAGAIAEETEAELGASANKDNAANAGTAVGSAAEDPMRTDGKLMSLMEKYQGLDFEDIVGGERFRFAYREVPADTFGLTAAEILESEDKELNRKVSLRFYAPYREGQPGPKRARQQDKRSRGYVRDGNGAAPARRAGGAGPSRGGDGRGHRNVAATDTPRPPPSAVADDGSGKDKKKMKRKRDDAALVVAEPAGTPTAPTPATSGAASSAGGSADDAPPKRSKVIKDGKKKSKPDATTPAPEAAAQAPPPLAADGASKHKRSKHAKQRTKKRDANRQAASSALSDSRLRAYAL
ncbi:hypothetical protein MMPV_007418 [Pyropia vietnamensis]